MNSETSMYLEKKDWEAIKREAEMQMKNAAITLVLNQSILDTAIINLEGYKKEDNIATSEDVQK